MGLLSRFASSIWSGIKRAASFVWTNALKPAVRAVCRRFVSEERVQVALERIEEGAVRLVAVLETDVSPLVKSWLDGLQAAFEQWAISRLGNLGVSLVAIIEQLENALGHRRGRVEVTAVSVNRPDWEN